MVKKTTDTDATETALGTCDEEFSGLDSGWAWAILLASFGIFCLLGCSMYAVGIIHSVLLERYGESVSLTSWAGALHIALFSLGGPLSSAVIDMSSCRVALTLSGVFLSSGYLGTAFAANIGVAIFTYGLLAGTGGALGYTAALVVVGFNFKNRRSLALGLALSGVGTGVFVLVPIMQLSRDYYGQAGFFILIAAMTANIVTFGVMCFPSKLEIHVMKQRNRGRQTQSKYMDLKPYFNVLANKYVISLSLSMFCFWLSISLIYLHLPTFIASKGYTVLQAAFLVSLSGILSMIGRVLTGLVSNINSSYDIILHSGTMLAVAIAAFFYPFVADHFAGHVLFAVVLGLFFGSCCVTVTAVTLPFVGMNYIAAAIGIQFFFAGIGALIGPVCAGYLVDAGGQYEQYVDIIAGYLVVAGG